MNYKSFSQFRALLRLVVIAAEPAIPLVNLFLWFIGLCSICNSAIPLVDLFRLFIFKRQLDFI